MAAHYSRVFWLKLFSVCQLTKMALKFWGVSCNQVCLLKPKKIWCLVLKATS